MSCGGCSRSGKRKNGAILPPAAAMCTALMPISISAFACSISLAYGLRARSLCDQVWVPTVMPASIASLVISGCQVAGSPTSKKVAFRHSSVSALITAGVLPEPRTVVERQNDFLVAQEIILLEMLEPKPGPPVVSISTVRPSPMAPGLSQGARRLVSRTDASGAGVSGAAAAFSSSAARRNAAAVACVVDGSGEPDVAGEDVATQRS